MGVRVTNHSGRVGKKGVYSAKHNDRNFQLEHAKHIDQSKSSENFYWKFNTEKILVSERDRNHDATFDEHESSIYYSLFSTQLAKINSNYLKQRHKEKVQSMEHFRTENKQYCPEETLMYLGNSEECVSPETLKKVFEEYRKWHEEKFPLCLWLDAAMHLDERTPHIHERHVWTASYTEYAEHYNETHKRKKELPDFENGEEDYLMIGQTESLRQMGIEPPEPNKPTSQYNNAKKTYTKMCREKIAEIGQRFGIEIILEPKDESENGLDLLSYKVRSAKKELETLQAESDSLIQKNNSIRKEIQQGKSESERLAKENQNAAAQLNETEHQITTNQSEIESLKKKIAELQQEILSITLPKKPIYPTEPIYSRPPQKNKEDYAKVMMRDYESTLNFIERQKERNRLYKEYDARVDEWNKYDKAVKEYDTVLYPQWATSTETVEALQKQLREVQYQQQRIEKGERALLFGEEIKLKRKNKELEDQVKELAEQKKKLQSQLDLIRSQIHKLAEQEYDRRSKHDAEVIAYYEQYCGISPDEIENAVMEQEKRNYDSD